MALNSTTGAKKAVIATAGAGAVLPQLSNGISHSLMYIGCAIVLTVLALKTIFFIRRRNRTNE